MPARRDETGLAAKGSQLQLAIYVNERQDELAKAIGRAADFPARVTLDWRSPLQIAGYVEYQDEAFLRAVGLEELATALREFWPARGSVWDGLAIANFPNGERGVVLVEAKSYPEEMHGPGSQAGASGSPKSVANREQIKRALEATQGWARSTYQDGERWMTGSHYQLANRLAHLYWLRHRQQVPAWLVQVLFVDDPYRPTSKETWEAAVEGAWAELGIHEDPPHTAWVTLPARDLQQGG